MSQPGFSGPLAASLGVSVRPSGPLRSNTEARSSYQELQQKYATLHKEYSDLHAALFEASQVYRSLCAPRLVRHGDFEIASETFAARYVPGDFVTVEETGN